MAQQDTRDRIFEAALEVCAEQGYHGTRMDEIVRRSGVSKGGVYHHFESKRELFLQLFDNLTAQVLEEAEEFSPEATTAEALGQMFQAFDAWLMDTRLLRAMTEFYLLGLQDEQMAERFARSYRGVMEFGTALIVRGMERGEVDPSLDPARTVDALFPAADGLVVMHLILGSADRVQQALRDYEMLMLRAIAPQS